MATVLGCMVAVMAAAACSGGRGGRIGNGTYTGVVYGDGLQPIACATIEVWLVDDAGEGLPPDRFPDESDGVARAVDIAACAADGTFELHVGVNEGNFRLVACGGITETMFSGATLELDADDCLTAVLVGIPGDAQLSGLVVSPLTTMAHALAEARIARGDKEPTWVEAWPSAGALLGAHVGDVDLVTTTPEDPTRQTAGTLSVGMRHGLALVSLSWLAETLAETTGESPTLVNALTLGAALADDLSSSEALFDGRGKKGGDALAVGTCPQPDLCPDEMCSTICDVGPRMVRNGWANALDAFIDSDANVTELGRADVAELALHIATNDEPELFGDVPPDITGAPITIDDTGFYVDATNDIWWTSEFGQTISGTVAPGDGEPVSVTVEVNDDVSVEAQVIENSVWIVEVPGNAWDLPPAVNTLRAISRDPVGNLEIVEQEVRLDLAGAEVAFLETTMKDERADTITFGSGTDVTHDHSMNVGDEVSLGTGGCPEVHKHVSLLAPGSADTNQLGFAFRVTDTETGVRPESVQYQVRFEGAATPVIDWTALDAMRPIPAGYEYDVDLDADKLPELATETARFEILVRGADQLGHGNERAQCWDWHPLAPPLEVSYLSSVPGALEDFSIQAMSLTPGIDQQELASAMSGGICQVPPCGANERAVAAFRIANPHDVPVRAGLFVPRPEASYTRRIVDVSPWGAPYAGGFRFGEPSANPCGGDDPETSYRIDIPVVPGGLFDFTDENNYTCNGAGWTEPLDQDPASSVVNATVPAIVDYRVRVYDGAQQLPRAPGSPGSIVVDGTTYDFREVEIPASPAPGIPKQVTALVLLPNLDLFSPKAGLFIIAAAETITAPGEMQGGTTGVQVAGLRFENWADCPQLSGGNCSRLIMRSRYRATVEAGLRVPASGVFLRARARAASSAALEAQADQWPDDDPFGPNRNTTEIVWSTTEDPYPTESNTESATTDDGD